MPEKIAGVNLEFSTVADPLVNDGFYGGRRRPRHNSSITSETKGLQILHTQTLHTCPLPSSFSDGRKD